MSETARRTCPTCGIVFPQEFYVKTVYVVNNSLNRDPWATVLHCGSCLDCMRKIRGKEKADNAFIDYDAMKNKRKRFNESILKAGFSWIIGDDRPAIFIDHTLTGKESIILATEISKSVERFKGVDK